MDTSEYVCKIASLEEMNTKWDYEIWKKIVKRGTHGRIISICAAVLRRL